MALTYLFVAAVLQPRTIAVCAFHLSAGRPRHQLDRRGSRLRCQHAVQDPSGISAVFGPVSNVDFVFEVVVGIFECNVPLDAAGAYPTLVALLALVLMGGS